MFLVFFVALTQCVGGLTSQGRRVLPNELCIWSLDNIMATLDPSPVKTYEGRSCKKPAVIAGLLVGYYLQDERASVFCMTTDCLATSQSSIGNHRRTSMGGIAWCTGEATVC